MKAGLEDKREILSKNYSLKFDLSLLSIYSYIKNNHFHK